MSQYNGSLGDNAVRAGAERGPIMEEFKPAPFRVTLEKDVEKAKIALADATRALEIFDKMPEEIEELVQIAARRGY
jgi:hypothetical protein